MEPRAISGVREDMGAPSISHELPIIQRYRGRIFPGNGYSNFPTTYESCESACKNASQCIAFSFFKASRRCTLFNDTSQYFSESGVDSGVKVQPAR
jgi:hypothetical protein